MDNRPILTIPMTMVEKILKTLSVFLIMLVFIYDFSIWRDLPERIAIHFNSAGKVDGWGGKNSIWLLPAISFFLFVLLSFLERFPQIFNYPIEVTEENAPKLYLEGRRLLAVISFEVNLLLSYISWAIVQAAYGRELLGMWAVPVFMVVIFGTIGIWFYRIFRVK